MALPIVPALATAFSVLSFIVASIQGVESSKNQFDVLAKSTEQLLRTLNSEFSDSRLVPTRCAKPLADLETLLREIHRFVEEEREGAFLKLLFQKDSRVARIELFHRRLGTCVDAFQISSLLNIQTMLADSKSANVRDTEALHANLVNLEKNNARLLQTLEINQNNTIAMMVSIQKQLNSRSVNRAEQNFYTHTLQYLTLRSGQSVKIEEWMISSFEIEYGLEIGAGGFGTVYQGTWNRTEVAIKVLQNVAGAKPSAASLRNEIEIWSTLRHPNILQFLGANTLDDKPFIVMPYIPHNARDFLRERPTLNPLPILRDISLGLEYLHSRKICHADLKAINVLVESTGRALLCDFGLARLKADAATRTLTTMDVSPVLGSRNWMAPELLIGSRYRVPVDIYAFGMTLYELYTDEIPLLSVPYGEFIDLVVHRGVRPERPEPDEGRTITDELWQLATRCWAATASDRPTATEVHDAIASMISNPHISPPEIVSASLPTPVRPTATEAHDAIASMISNPHVSPPEIVSASLPTPVVQALPPPRLYPGRKKVQSGVIDNFSRPTNVGKPSSPGPPPIGKSTSVQAPSSPFPAVPEVSEMAEHLQGADLDGLIGGQEWDLDTNGLRRLATLQENVLSQRQQTLGSDHTDTLLAASNLGSTYFRLGMLQQAEELQARVVDKRKRVFGLKHQETLTAMFHLAATYRALRRLDDVLAMGEEVIGGRNALLGTFNLQTLTAAHAVGLTYHALGNYEEAKRYELVVFQERKRILGIKHRDTVMAMKALAVYRALHSRDASNSGGSSLKDTFDRTFTALKKGGE